MPGCIARILLPLALLMLIRAENVYKRPEDLLALESSHFTPAFGGRLPSQNGGAFDSSKNDSSSSNVAFIATRPGKVIKIDNVNIGSRRDKEEENNVSSSAGGFGSSSTTKTNRMGKTRSFSSDSIRPSDTNNWISSNGIRASGDSRNSSIRVTTPASGISSSRIVRISGRNRRISHNSIGANGSSSSINGRNNRIGQNSIGARGENRNNIRASGINSRINHNNAGVSSSSINSMGASSNNDRINHSSIDTSGDSSSTISRSSSKTVSGNGNSDYIRIRRGNINGPNSQGLRPRTSGGSGNVYGNNGGFSGNVFGNSGRQSSAVYSGANNINNGLNTRVVDNSVGYERGGGGGGIGGGRVDGGNNFFVNNREKGPIPGIAGVDYPALAYVPQTGFTCNQRGYYADTAPEASCQVFHICQNGARMDSFLCPNGTVFNQQYFVCDWWFNFDCSTAQEFYGLNDDIGRVTSSGGVSGGNYGNNIVSNSNSQQIPGFYQSSGRR